MLTTTSLNNADKTGSQRVIHVLRAPVGGLFRHVCDLVHEQCAQGLEVGIACDSSTGGAHADSAFQSLAAICKLGIHRVPMRRMPGWSDLKAARVINRIVRDVAPDILHGHGAKGAAYARLLARRNGAKAIYTPHGGSLHFSFATLHGGIYLTLERLLRSRTDGLIFESEYARHSYLDNVGLLPCPYKVIHNGLHESEFARLPRRPPSYDFIFVGEIRKIKGIHVFLDAISHVAQHQTVTVQIIGHGNEEKSVRSRISDLGLTDFVELSPPVPRASDAFARAKCIVVPSLAESLPYVVLECIAAGVPLLATKVGGIPEIYGPFANQLLPPGDPAALAMAMRPVLLDLQAARENAEMLRSHIRQRFLVPQMAEAITSFYREIIGRKEITAENLRQEEPADAK